MLTIALYEAFVAYFKALSQHFGFVERRKSLKPLIRIIGLSAKTRNDSFLTTKQGIYCTLRHYLTVVQILTFDEHIGGM